MVNAYHFTFVQTHRMYNTNSEPSSNVHYGTIYNSAILCYLQ